MTTEALGLIVIDPTPDPRVGLRVANGAAEVKPNQAFWLFLSTFTRKARHLTKNIVVVNASKSPLALTEVSETIRSEIASCLNITGDAPQGTSTSVNKEEGTSIKVKDFKEGTECEYSTS